jgi:hypothetical protein
MKYKLVIVDWVDSAGGQGWCDIKTVISAPKSVKCKSVGYKIAETKDCIIIASHLSYGGLVEDVNQVQGDMVIPKVSIVKVKQL